MCEQDNRIHPPAPENTGRRKLFSHAAVLAGAGGLASLGLLAPQHAQARPLTREQRDQLSCGHVLQRLKEGNARFLAGKGSQHDYLAQKRASTAGQYPASMIVSCVDSRAPAEIIMDIPIGDSFNGRVAGNVVNPDLLGSLEFACAIAGAKLIVVMGHTGCGAIKGAIDGIELGHLTALVDRIAPAVQETVFDGERSSGNAAFVDAVAATHVRRVVNDIRVQSRVLARLETRREIRLVSAMYNLQGGAVQFFD